MRDYATLFTRIVEIMSRDYAGFENNPAHGQNTLYLSQLKRLRRLGKLDDGAFVSAVDAFLGEYRDRSLRLTVKNTDTYKRESCGFRARRYGDGLYVTEIREEKRLGPGAVITEINRVPVSQVAGGSGTALYGGVPEREFWDIPLNAAWSYKLGSGKEIKAGKYPYIEPRGELSLKTVDGAAVVTLTGAVTAAAAARFFAAKDAALRAAERLILDLRRAEGDDLDAFFPLAPFIAHREQKLSELFDTGGAWVNYSDGNCAAWRSIYRAFAAGSGDDGKAILSDMTAELDEKAGKGFIFEPDEPLGSEDRDIVPDDPAKKTVILTDMGCGGEAERFVSLAAKSPRVALVGRATMGSAGFCRPLRLTLDDALTLLYPTAKAAAFPGGTGGIAPASEIPWTPGELFRDKPMETALKL